ncbi:hypothetical protein ES705_46698 [subsurface metagenome]
MEIEITNYLTRISEEPVSTHGSESINLLLFIITNVENIGDACHSVAQSMERKIDQKISFSDDIDNNFKVLTDLVIKAPMIR